MYFFWKTSNVYGSHNFKPFCKINFFLSFLLTRLSNIQFQHHSTSATWIPMIFWMTLSWTLSQTPRYVTCWTVVSRVWCNSEWEFALCFHFLRGSCKLIILILFYCYNQIFDAYTQMKREVVLRIRLFIIWRIGYLKCTIVLALRKTTIVILTENKSY